MGDCRHCGKKAGFLRGVHGECKEAYQSGWEAMISIAATAAESPGLDLAQLRQDLASVANRTYWDEEGINRAISEGWHRAVRFSMVDEVLTLEEEQRLREFRDLLAVKATDEADVALEVGAQQRVSDLAQNAALATRDADKIYNDLAEGLRGLHLTPEDEKLLLADAWEMAVGNSLEDGLLSIDEEAALHRYLQHWNLSIEQVNHNGAHLNMVKSVVLRELDEGILPDHLGDRAYIPFNMMKSEKLIWLIDGVEYYETKTMRESRGSSHGVSIRVARGVYYRPSTFKSRTHTWDETVHADTGLWGVTTKHIYFHGSKKRFRVRLEKIVSYEPYSDSIEIMRDTQTAKPELFMTGDGWFAYNLVTLAAEFNAT